MLTKDMIEQRHIMLTKLHGGCQANLVMRVLRAILNFASLKHENDQGEPLLASNPVSRLSQMKSWNRVNRRTRYLKLHELKPWFESVLKMRNSATRDLLLLLLLTGLRKEEGATLRWSNVNLSEAIIRIPDPKNRQDLEIPISDYVVELLKRRRLAAASTAVFVFAGRSPDKPLSKNHDAYCRRIVVDESGVSFSPHDLRRTYATYLDVTGAPFHIIKKLLNHRGRTDITESYICLSVERLRGPVQAVTDYILREAEIRR
jgi:integrase